MSRPRPALLCILDGWGWRPDHAAGQRHRRGATRPTTPACWPNARMRCWRPPAMRWACPRGQMGNSEVGHMNIGAGRVVAQDLPRIDVAIEDGSLARRPALLALIDKAKGAKGAVHVMGLLSPGGVHSHQDHIAALVKIVSAAAVPVFVHAFLDGRDTPPKSARGFLEKFLRRHCRPGRRAAGHSVGPLLRHGPRQALGPGGEMLCRAWWMPTAAASTMPSRRWRHPTPTTSPTSSWCPACWATMPGIEDGDVLLFANFRADRAREISTALLDKGFDGFDRARVRRSSAPRPA